MGYEGVWEPDLGGGGWHRGMEERTVLLLAENTLFIRQSRRIHAHCSADWAARSVERRPIAKSYGLRLERSEQIVHLTRLCMLCDLRRRTRSSERSSLTVIYVCYLYFRMWLIQFQTCFSRFFWFRMLRIRYILYSMGSSVSSKHADEADGAFYNVNNYRTHYSCVKKLETWKNLIGFYTLLKYLKTHNPFLFLYTGRLNFYKQTCVLR